MITSLLERFKNNDFVKSVSVLVSGSIIARLIGLFTLPIVSRLYSPEDFGENGVILATAAIISSLGSLGLNSAVMIPKSDKESDIVFKVAFFTSTSIYITLFLLAFIFSQSYQLAKTSLPYLITSLLIFLLAFSSQLSGILSTYINRKGMNRVLFYNSIISALATLFVTIPLGFLKVGVLGLVIASLVSGLLCSLQMIYYANPFKQKITKRDFILVFKKYKDFVIYQYPSNFIGTFAIQLPTRFLSANYGNDKLGIYNMNERIFGIPLQLLATPITTVYFRTASKLQDQTDDLARLTFKLIRNIMLVSIVPIVIIALFGEELFSFALGSQWATAGKLASVLVVQYVFDFCSNSISYCRVALNRQKLNLWIVIIRLIIVVSSLYIGMYIYNDVFSVVVLYSISMTLYYIIDMAFNFIALKKYTIKYLIFSTIYALLAFLLVFLIR